MRGHKLPLICLVLLASGPLMAHDDRMLLELCVNGNCYGSAFVLLRDQHILVDEDALKRAQLPLQHMPEQMIGSKRFIDVGVYAHDSKVQLDINGGRLSLTLPASAFGNQRLDINPRPQQLTATAVPSAFVNYALNVGTSRSDSSVYLDTGFAYGHGLLRDNPSWNQPEGFSRGLTRFEDDDTDHMQRFTIGDQYAYSSDGLGGTALLGGVGLVRAFDLNPYLITFPQPTISGLLQAPGTVDIYENGALVGQRQVSAGPFNLASLGLGAGANNVRVVVRDPFGGSTVLQQNFYGASQMLAQGLSDYAYEVGVERSSTLANGYEAGRGVLLARENYGFTDAVTAGYRVEAENGLVNAGSSMSLRLPLGVLSAGVAASNADGARGHGSSLTYQFNDRYFSFGSGIQVYSSAYLRMGDDLLPAAFRTRRLSYVNASWNPSTRLSLQISAGSTLYDDGTQQRNIGLDSALNLTGGISLTLALNRQLNQPGISDNQLMFDVVIPLGRSSIGFNAAHDARNGNSYGLSAQRSVPSDSGWGYSVNAQNGNDGTSGLGQLDYQGQYGLVQLTDQRFGGQSNASALVSGSLVALDDHVYAGRVLQNGYALIETPGTASVEITRENQSIGKTDADGNLLVTNLLPYQANRVGIDQNSVPLQDQIDTTEQVISVPRLGGTVVRFGVHAVHAARGVLMLDGKVAPYGTAMLKTKDAPMKTLIGLDGSFYFSDLPAGSYTLLADTANGDLTCRFTMPSDTRLLTNLGKIACIRSAGGAP